MQYVQKFLQFEYSDEIMLAVGAFLVLFAVIQIVRSSLKLLFWVIVAGVGTLSASYGLRYSPYDLPALTEVNLSNIQDLAPGLNADVLDFLCAKLEAGDQ